MWSKVSQYAVSGASRAGQCQGPRADKRQCWKGRGESKKARRKGQGKGKGKERGKSAPPRVKILATALWKEFELTLRGAVNIRDGVGGLA